MQAHAPLVLAPEEDMKRSVSSCVQGYAGFSGLLGGEKIEGGLLRLDHERPGEKRKTRKKETQLAGYFSSFCFASFLAETFWDKGEISREKKR